LRSELNAPRLDERMRTQQRSLITALRAVFQLHRDAVLHAPTGAGKSTLLPLALWQQELPAGKKILMLEPRRLAARAVAQRMAMLLGEPIGATVGYRMRLDTRVSPHTRIEVVTEAVLTRLLQEDPSLEHVAYLIFDEYHERSLAADLGLALALDARETLEAAFRIVIMSATLECERVVALLGDAAVASVPGRAFPVDLHYLGSGAPILPDAMHSLERPVAQAVQRAADSVADDILVFLPGAAEIRRVEAVLREGNAIPGALLLPLYGDMSADSQDVVLAPAPAGRRKIVLATNIAQTSLTIPGVTAVVDTGLERRSRFDPTTGMSRLELTRISRAASDQRAGRAGRVAPGACFRLWSEAAQTRLEATTPPEILEADLAPLALELARWGSADASRLRWLDAPPAPSLQQARALLQRLDALDARGSLTALGRDMSRLPLHPRLAHMLLLSRRLDALATAAQLAALLSERDLLRRGVARGQRDPDVRTRLDLMHGERGAASDRHALQRAQRAAQSLAQEIRNVPEPIGAPWAHIGGALQLAGALLSLAYPDRIGQRRSDGEARYLLANGRGARFDSATSLAREEFIVALELDDREREARIDLAAPLARAHLEQLFATRMVDEEQFGWDVREEAVLARRVRRLDALLIDSSARSPPDDQRTLAAMLQGIAQLGCAALPWDAESRTLQARMEFVRKLQRSDLADWPASDDAALMVSAGDWLAPYLQGVTRRSHLANVPLLAALRARLTAAQTRALDTLAPRDVLVPSGSHIRIDYVDENAPCVSVKLQEVFGLQHTPSIGGGAVPVTFKLLSPAQRPVQITRDLAGFWRSSYVDVRKDMRGRYPRHHWPENPLEATPSRRSLKAPARGPKR
jgi:ATP-dependent helicase HrpB